MITAALLLSGCGDKPNEEEKAAPQPSVQQEMPAKEAAEPMMKEEPVQEAMAKMEPVKEEVEQKAAEVKEEIEEKAAEVKEEVTEAVSEVSAQTLYAKCQACHGAKAEKKALGVSDIIAQWDAKKIEDALKGYQDGTYGGNMKTVMAGQVKSLSSDDIKALAEHIANF
jgi:cytochrome c553